MGRAAALIAGLAACAALALEAAAGERFAHGTLWRVSRPGVPPSYVFGTIHLADPRVLDIPEPVRQALARSRSFAMEAPKGGAHGWRMYEAAQLPEGQGLEAFVGSETFGKLRRMLAARAIPESLIARLKPWAALANITVTPEDYEGETLDQKLFGMARARRLKIEALEGTEEHISVFDGIPLETQVAMLRHTVEQRDYLVGMIEPTLQAWLRRDLAGIHAVNQRIAARFPDMAPHYAVLTRHLVDNRSVVMAHRLYLKLRAGGVFVAVGAGHLYGRNGILRLIERQGYRVRRVY
ncbi:MAG: TraB/GumN family protein [Pseudomonadota bacterium]